MLADWMPVSLTVAAETINVAPVGVTVRDVLLAPVSTPVAAGALATLPGRGPPPLAPATAVKKEKAVKGKRARSPAAADDERGAEKDAKADGGGAGAIRNVDAVTVNDVPVVISRVTLHGSAPLSAVSLLDGAARMRTYSQQMVPSCRVVFLDGFVLNGAALSATATFAYNRLDDGTALAEVCLLPRLVVKNRPCVAIPRNVSAFHLVSIGVSKGPPPKV